MEPVSAWSYTLPRLQSFKLSPSKADTSRRDQHVELFSAVLHDNSFNYLPVHLSAMLARSWSLLYLRPFIQRPLPDRHISKNGHLACPLLHISLGWTNFKDGYADLEPIYLPLAGVDENVNLVVAVLSQSFQYNSSV